MDEHGRDAEAAPYVVDVDWAEQSVTRAVISALGEVTGERDTALDPLYDHVDPDALESLFEPTEGADRAEGAVSFPYGDYVVTVYARGRIDVRPAHRE